MPTAQEEEQAERRAYLENEKLLREKSAEDKRASTYLAMAEAASLEIGGRYKQVSPMSITGTTPVPQYPALPANSPAAIAWPEGPDVYGEPIDQLEPVGSDKEIEEAAAILQSRLAVPPASSGPVTDAPETSLAVERVTGPLTNSSAFAPAASAKGGVAFSKVGATPPSHSRSLRRL
jgi:hypothetical protein